MNLEVLSNPAFSDGLKKLIRIMKFTAILILAACLQVCAKGYSQESITLKEKNAPLEKVIKDLIRITKYNFLYDPKLLKEKGSNIDIDLKNVTLQQALEQCFKDQPLTYVIENRFVVIKEKEVKKNEEPNTLTDISTQLTGKVVDKTTTLPLVGATVQVKGKKVNAITDDNGLFVFNSLDDNAILIITYTGYASKEVNVTGKTSLTVQLEQMSSQLDEVQIIAYGKTTKRLNTGDVSTVKAEDIEKQPVQNPLLALQGRVPGLFILQPSGLAGSSVKIQIQGQNSISNGNDPLYVIDGVPIISSLPMTGVDGVLGPTGPNYSGNGNPLNYIDVSDIESIDILKDADATAIYGSRAANGAILITTKKGKAGPTQFNVNLETGWGNVTRTVDMLNTRQYLDMRYEAYQNDNIDWKSPYVSANDLKVWDTTRYTNWQKELIGNTANYNSINANISGGTPTVQFLVGGTYNRQTTVFPISSDFADTKISFNSNLTATSLDQRFRMQFSSGYTFDKNQLPSFDLTPQALLLEPDAPNLYNPDGSINWAPNEAGRSTFYGNPMILTQAKYWNKTDNLISNLVIGYKILKGLELSGSFGYNKMHTNDFRPNPITAIAPENRALNPSQAEYGERSINSWIIEPQLSYRTQVNKVKLEGLFGSTLQNLKTDANALRGIGYLSDAMLENVNAAAYVSSIYSSRSEYKYNAGFARLNFNWSDKYILDLNARRDGSSRFGGGNRFHNFGSMGIAWLFSNENFIKKNFSFLSFGKIKASYGTTGNDQIGDYSYLSLYNVYPVQVAYQNIVSLTAAGLPNPHLQWEETKKLQFGLDLGFFHDKLIMDFTYARNRSSSQLLSYQLPSITGFLSYLQNFPALIQNRNWEFFISSKNISTKNVSWTSSFNLTFPQNKLLSFPNLAQSTYSTRLVIGQPINIEQLYHFVGVDANTGSYLFSTKDGDTTSPDVKTDRTVLISTMPKFYGGLENTISYKGFELDFLFQFVKQMGFNDLQFWNGNRTPGSFYTGLSNQPVSVLARWQEKGDNSVIAKFSSYNYFGSPVISSDYRFTDASYIRLKNVAISWEVPRKWIGKTGFKKCRLYAHAQNLLTITNYKGLDPENQSILSPTLPPLRVVTAGIQLGF